MKTSFLNNKQYDVLKFIAQIVLPALGTLYLALSGIWGFPNGEQVVGSVMAVDFFLGALLGLSSSNYEPPVSEGTPVGDFVIQDHGDGKKTVNLSFNSDPETFLDQDSITFVVNRGENSL